MGANVGKANIDIDKEGDGEDKDKNESSCDIFVDAEAETVVVDKNGKVDERDKNLENDQSSQGCCDGDGGGGGGDDMPSLDVNDVECLVQSLVDTIVEEDHASGEEDAAVDETVEQIEIDEERKGDQSTSVVDDDPGQVIIPVNMSVEKESSEDGEGNELGVAESEADIIEDQVLMSVVSGETIEEEDDTLESDPDSNEGDLSSASSNVETEVCQSRIEPHLNVLVAEGEAAGEEETEASKVTAEGEADWVTTERDSNMNDDIDMNEMWPFNHVKITLSRRVDSSNNDDGNGNESRGSWVWEGNEFVFSAKIAFGEAGDFAKRALQLAKSQSLSGANPLSGNMVPAVAEPEVTPDEGSSDNEEVQQADYDDDEDDDDDDEDDDDDQAIRRSLDRYRFQPIPPLPEKHQDEKNNSTETVGSIGGGDHLSKDFESPQRSDHDQFSPPPTNDISVGGQPQPLPVAENTPESELEITCSSVSSGNNEAINDKNRKLDKEEAGSSFKPGLRSSRRISLKRKRNQQITFSRELVEAVTTKPVVSMEPNDAQQPEVNSETSPNNGIPDNDQQMRQEGNENREALVDDNNENIQDVVSQPKRMELRKPRKVAVDPGNEKRPLMRPQNQRQNFMDSSSAGLKQVVSKMNRAVRINTPKVGSIDIPIGRKNDKEKNADIPKDAEKFQKIFSGVKIPENLTPAEISFPCPFCPEGFLQPGDLITHLPIHKKPKEPVQVEPEKSTSLDEIRKSKRIKTRKDNHAKEEDSGVQSSEKISTSSHALLEKKSLPKMKPCKVNLQRCDVKRSTNNSESQLEADQSTAKNNDHPNFANRNLERRNRQQRSSKTKATGTMSNGMEVTKVKLSNGQIGFKCSVCKAIFSSRSNAFRHFAMHKGDKSHKCPYCTRAFWRKDELTKHNLSKHADEKPKITGATNSHKMCSEGFSSAKNLRSHFLLHTGVKPHGCKLCSKRFITPSKLKNHLYSHSTERFHKCERCKQTFKYLSNLRRHIKQQHNLGS